MKVAHVLCSLFVYTSFTSAWPWPPSLRDSNDIILRRQDGGDESSTRTAAASTTSAKNSDSASAASSSSPASNSAQPTNSASGTAAASSDSVSGSGSAAATTGTASSDGSKMTGKSSSGQKATSTRPPRTTSIDDTLPAGGIEMMTPAATATTTYYKIGDVLTFGWNYTSLILTPSAINVIVSCTSAAYTVTTDLPVKASGVVHWNTSLEVNGADALGTDYYTLVVYDSSSQVTAVPKSGELGTYNQFRFGMYKPQPYQDSGVYVCATCSGAMSDMERTTLKFVFIMVGVTVLSFGWFAGGFLSIF